MGIDDGQTIAAISTALSPAGIGIIRMSGTESIRILERIFRRSHGNVSPAQEDRKAIYGTVISSSEEVIDECICICMKGPRSFTGEDVVELHCHGGLGILRAVLDRVLELGARLAEPGEFTKRALLSGRIDLSQAEAINEAIRAKTASTAKLAARQLQGRLGNSVSKIRNNLLMVMASLEASIDFPDEVGEIDRDELMLSLHNVLDALEKTLSAMEHGQIFRRGALVAIVGRPNVGKSSLMNALLGHERAIVTPIAGTTRDLIEEEIDVDGIALRIVDTAGLRETIDEVELIGVKKAHDVAEDADIVVFLVDGSSELSQEDRAIATKIDRYNTILVANKSDLPTQLDVNQLISLLPSNNNVISISAKSGAGIDTLKKALIDCLCAGCGIDNTQDPYLATRRQQQAVIFARDEIRSVIDALENQMPNDIASIGIREALYNLGLLTGQTVSDDILKEIFSGFCIGK